MQNSHGHNHDSRANQNRNFNQQTQILARKTRENAKHTKTPYKTRQHTAFALKRSSCNAQNKQNPGNAECALSRHRCLTKSAFPGHDETKTYYSAKRNWWEPGGQPGGQPGEEPGGQRPQRVAEFWDSYPAITLVFAEGSVRTHNLKLVGKIYTTSRSQKKIVPTLDFIRNPPLRAPDSWEVLFRQVRERLWKSRGTCKKK